MGLSGPFIFVNSAQTLKDVCQPSHNGIHVKRDKGCSGGECYFFVQYRYCICCILFYFCMPRLRLRNLTTFLYFFQKMVHPESVFIYYYTFATCPKFTTRTAVYNVDSFQSFGKVASCKACQLCRCCQSCISQECYLRCTSFRSLESHRRCNCCQDCQRCRSC